MSDVIDFKNFRVGAPGFVGVCRYDAFCAARRDFLAAAVAWIRSDQADPEIIAQEMAGAVNAIRALPDCLGKGLPLAEGSDA